MRALLYRLKRDYGNPIEIYKEGTPTFDTQTGARTVPAAVTNVVAAVLPAKVIRETVRNVAVTGANREFAFGGAFDTSLRSFLVASEDTPGFTPTADDWIVFNGVKYGIKQVDTIEFDMGWLLTAKALVGETPNRIILARADDFIRFSEAAE
jgi:hypothetical protein